MDSIRQRFLQAWDDFLLVLQSDKKYLSAFAERWQTLWSDWESCLHQADQETQQLVGEVAGKIEGLANDFYLFESRALSLKDDLLNGLEDVFASLDLEEKTVTQLGPDPVPVSSTERDAVSPAQWLLRNLHNPYPSPHVRFSEGRSANCKHVKDWFSKARQRIGWTRMLRDRFAGCRTITTDAAFRAFVRDDPCNPLDGDLKTTFLAIKSHAELVYGDKTVVPSSLQRPRSISPTPSLTFSCGSEDTSDEPYPTTLLEENFQRPRKRNLSNSPKFSSPKRRRVGPSLPLSPSPMEANPPCAKTPPLHSRKRRLSETDFDCSQPKRPRGAEDDRFHVESGPLPASLKPTWPDFDQIFQMPNSASICPPDPTSFYLDFFGHGSCVDSSGLTPPTAIAAPADASTALFEMPRLDLLQSSLPSFDSDWGEFLNFESHLPLFQSPSSLASSLAGTPPLIDDAVLSPPSFPDSGPSSPDSHSDILPRLSQKSTQFPSDAEPMIWGQDFLRPPGDDAGILSANFLFSMF